MHSKSTKIFEVVVLCNSLKLQRAVSCIPEKRTEDHREDPRTQDTKEDSFNDCLKEDPITEDLNEHPNNRYKKEVLITEDPRIDRGL